MDDDEAMMRLLGFSGAFRMSSVGLASCGAFGARAGFESTKGTHVADNDSTAARGAVRKVPKREYRQYMHRKGGFNRPLSPSVRQRGRPLSPIPQKHTLPLFFCARRDRKSVV